MTREEIGSPGCSLVAEEEDEEEHPDGGVQAEEHLRQGDALAQPGGGCIRLLHGASECDRKSSCAVGLPYTSPSTGMKR